MFEAGLNISQSDLVYTDTLKEKLITLKKENEKLKKENEELKEENYKLNLLLNDEAKLQQRIEQLRQIQYQNGYNRIDLEIQKFRYENK